MRDCPPHDGSGAATASVEPLAEAGDVVAGRVDGLARLAEHLRGRFGLHARLFERGAGGFEALLGARRVLLGERERSLADLQRAAGLAQLALQRLALAAGGLARLAF